MAVGRSDLASPRVGARLLSGGATLAVLGYGAGWLSTRWWGQAASTQAWVDGELGSRSASLAWLSGAAPHSGTTFEIVGSVGVALVVIAVCLLVADPLPRTVFPLAAVGSTALSTYAGGIVAVAITGTLDYTTNRPWLVYVLFTIVAATLW